MATKVHSLEVYEQLAGWYDRQGQAKLRDWFLVLAADIACSAGQQDDAERLRQRLLHGNPHHLLRPFASFAEALQAPDVRNYLADLRRHYPLETAEQLLASARKKPLSATAPEARDTVSPRQDDRELKVYRGKEPAAEATPSPPIRRQEKPRQPAFTTRTPVKVSWTRPPRSPAVRRPVPPAAPVQLPEQDEDEDESTCLSWWVSIILFTLTMLVATSLTVYALIVPFLAGH